VSTARPERPYPLLLLITYFIDSKSAASHSKRQECVEVMKRRIVHAACLSAAYLLIFYAVSGALITIATNDLRAYCDALRIAIWCAASAATVLVTLAVVDKSTIVRCFAIAGLFPLIFVAYDFLRRYHPPYCGEP